jgi:hypothetical protein
LAGLVAAVGDTVALNRNNMFNKRDWRPPYLFSPDWIQPGASRRLTASLPVALRYGWQ